MKFMIWKKGIEQGRVCWDVYGEFGTHAGFPTVYRTDSGYQCRLLSFKTLKAAKLYAFNFWRRNPF